MPKLQYDLVVYMKRAINNDVSKSGSHSRPNDELCARSDDPLELTFARVGSSEKVVSKKLPLGSQIQ